MTPNGIVAIILDSIGYVGEHVLTKTIMEPSFGDGVFLINIVTRVISEGKKRGMDTISIKRILRANIFGIEKDPELYQRTLKKLNSLLDVYDMGGFDWSKNLYCGDTLLLYPNFQNKMDYVVGNPPYIRIHNIPTEYRSIVKEFRFVDGMMDLYIVFYEIGILMLNNTGKLGYISPNSFMKNTSQRKFRNYLVDRKYISAIYDFKTSKIFDGVDVYTCICLLNKNDKRVDFSIEYREYAMHQTITQNRFSYDYFKNQLANEAWNLSSNEDIEFLERNKSLSMKIMDIAVVQNGIATNKDSIYIFKVYEDQKFSKPYMGMNADPKKIVYFRDKEGMVWPIESTILHRCVKASKFSGNIDNTYILFPYEKNLIPKFFKKDNTEVISGYTPLSEEKLRKCFPCAYQYLSALYDELISRDMDKNSEWFLFGRSQGLQNSGYKKIVFKHIINKTSPVITPHILDEDVIVYSGIYTTIDTNIVTFPKTGNSGHKETDKYIFDEALYDFALEEVNDIYTSPEFARYCALTGKDMAGGYVGLSTKIVKNFGTTITNLLHKR